MSLIKEEEKGNSSIIGKLRDLDPQILTDFTKNEHPQTIALILSQLDPDQEPGSGESVGGTAM